MILSSWYIIVLIYHVVFLGCPLAAWLPRSDEDPIRCDPGAAALAAVAPRGEGGGSPHAARHVAESVGVTGISQTPFGYK